MTKRIEWEEEAGGSDSIRGWRTVKRWLDPDVWDHEFVAWYVRSGFLAVKVEFQDGLMRKVTEWNSDGELKSQSFDHSFSNFWNADQYIDQAQGG